MYDKENIVKYIKHKNLDLLKQALDSSDMSSLDLSRSYLNCDDVIILLGALQNQKHITSLNLESNQIGDIGANAFSDNNIIKMLNLSNNIIGNLGAEGLARNTSIIILNLYGNKIRDAGAIALANNNSILVMNLRYNNIENIGANAFFNNRTIIYLNLNGNVITTVGIETITKNITIPELKFCQNDIPEKTKFRFVKEIKKNKIYLDKILDLVIKNSENNSVCLPFELYQAMEYLNISEDSWVSRVNYRMREKDKNLTNEKLSEVRELVSKEILDKNFAKISKIIKINIIPQAQIPDINKRIFSYIKANDILPNFKDKLAMKKHDSLSK